MYSLGKTIKRLRACKGETQEQLAEKLHISCQAVSKWENNAALPDISLLPQISDHFGISIDELLGHKLNAYTYKERFVQLMANSGVLSFEDDGRYIINTENFTTNAHISKIGECFADFIRDNNLTFDAVMGLAYHGIAFSCATACSLYQKYGETTAFFFDRKVSDSRGRDICGYTPLDGDRIIVIDDMIGSGISLDQRLERLMAIADVDLVAVIAIVDQKAQREDGICGTEYIEEKYSTKVFTLISDEDLRMALDKHII